jgi:hypothetical protein
MLLQDEATNLRQTTSEVLKDLEFAEQRVLKRLYNYTLTATRENRELADEVQDEYTSIKSDIKMMNRIKAVDKQLSFANMKKKEKGELMEGIFRAMD